MEHLAFDRLQFVRKNKFKFFNQIYFGITYDQSKPLTPCTVVYFKVKRLWIDDFVGGLHHKGCLMEAINRSISWWVIASP